MRYPPKYRRELERDHPKTPGEWCHSAGWPLEYFDGEPDETSIVECPCCGKEVSVVKRGACRAPDEDRAGLLVYTPTVQVPNHKVPDSPECKFEGGSA